jgi:hypothetical protein
MNTRTEWTTHDFDDMSWHDVHVHGFHLRASAEENVGTAELYLDIDYILQWGVREEKGFRFVVAQAILQFHDVFGLKLALDYEKVSAGMCAFSIDGIKREMVSYPNGHSSYKWFIEVNWPTGFIEFESPGFTQRLVGDICPDSGLSLPPPRRKAWQPL